MPQTAHGPRSHSAKPQLKNSTEGGDIECAAPLWQVEVRQKHRQRLPCQGGDQENEEHV
jgi:hypothetical protein